MAEAHRTGAWAPLSHRVYRWLFLAQLGSNIGTWMQTVGAQWLLIGHAHAATLVALVQTASLLPVMVLSLPAGVLADVLDRRRLLLATQGSMAVVAAVLAGLTAAGLTTPVLLLALTFLLGCGQALGNPAWQAIQPELVDRDELPAAAALGSLTVNLARAVGPALAGVLVAVVGAGAVFGINALSFIGVVVALGAWRRPVTTDPGVAERSVAALQAGARYVRHAPAVRRLLLRAGLFVVPASALWALLPVVANESLKLGAGGYGILLGALGVGAVAAALGLGKLRAVFSANQLLAGGALVFGLGTLCLALVRSVPVITAVLVLTGVAWLAVLSTLNAAMQLTLPAWVRARGLASYLLVFMGGQAVGSLAWGLLAGATSTRWALLVAGGLLLVVAASVPALPLLASTGKLDRTPTSYWPEPALVFEPGPDDGPVLVVRRYTVTAEHEADFLVAMGFLARSRQRTGASRWELYRDGSLEQRFVEEFLVPSWGEHLRQHSTRLTGADQQLQTRVDALVEGEPTVEHLFPALSPRGRITSTDPDPPLAAN